MRIVIHLVFGLAAVSVAAGDDSRLRDMLASAATNQGSAYLEARAEILALGTNALPTLGRCAVASDLTWQQCLVARICYERLVRGEDIEALRAYDWRTDKGYDKQWERFITGPSIKMGTIVVPKCREIGLWYYYVELTWKETGELPVCGKCLKPLQKYTNPSERYAELERRQKEGLRSCIHQDERFQNEWPNWCLEVFTGEPEKYWCRQAVSERMLGTPFSRWHIASYNTFLNEKTPENLPVLTAYSELYFQSRVAGSETYPGARDVTFRHMFSTVLSFADSRYADMLEKFISEKPALEPLKKRLAEVRARPAPSPVTEPPFRLDTNAVMIVP